MQNIDRFISSVYRPDRYDSYNNVYVYVGLCPDCDHTTDQQSEEDIAKALLISHVVTDHSTDSISFLLKENTDV